MACSDPRKLQAMGMARLKQREMVTFERETQKIKEINVVRALYLLFGKSGI